MKLKIPPVIVFLIALMIIIGCYYLFPSLSYSLPYGKILSRLFLFLGVLAGILGIIAFRSHQTTVDPMNPQKASTLVTKGIYAHTRNPMYLGMALVLLGSLLRLGNLPGVAGLVFFVGYLTRFQIRPEEQVLKEVFGEAYIKYCHKVRRWI